jgi:hypothetical protein
LTPSVVGSRGGGCGCAALHSNENRGPIRRYPRFTGPRGHDLRACASRVRLRQQPLAWYVQRDGKNGYGNQSTHGLSLNSSPVHGDLVPNCY